MSKPWTGFWTIKNMLYFIVIGGTLATVTMTLFSLLVSKLTGRLYREPVLINVLLPPGIGKYQLAGYAIHLLIGWALAMIYYLFVGFEWVEVSYQSGLIFGLVAGLMAVGVWKLLFVLSAPPPDIHLMGYFAQLVVAHLIFGLTLILVATW